MSRTGVDAMRRAMDHAAVFAATPSPILVLNPDLIIVEANPAYLEATGRRREELIGRYIFEVFPGNPADTEGDGIRSMKASLQRVLNTGMRDTLAIQKYDIPVAEQPGVFEERYWCPINAPVLGPDGEVELIIHRAEDITSFVRQLQGEQVVLDPSEQSNNLDAELYARTLELQRANEELRQAHAREHEVGLALQRAMLPEISAKQYPGAAVRYLPAVGALNVCGDWYDLVELDERRLAVAVGDVVGNGLPAACVMGQLRSALSAATRAVDGPARALEVLCLYARSIEGALATTAVQVVIDKETSSIAYSSAGHLPPLLLHADGSVEFLDRATHAPLGATPELMRPPQARTSYQAGDVLVLYTDGLVERRGEDIDIGMERLAGSLARHGGQEPEALADALLADLDPLHSTSDDIALIVIRL
ncbi:PP2C family protein-serine/threonine phosphatase [Sphaerisporangium fuscum]|uniref:PP2C family protein-serine/threonine phosphatase n=1 Tax=Sphaerisporangium fuscum TaxID=2835868 RepID=UPI001BDBE057|nr:SpoIIE family protein phosphatase [Sphaerisporangium fuscum]